MEIFRAGEIHDGLFTTFHANTPDVERFAEKTFPSVLMIRGKCSCLRAISAYPSGHLPPVHLI
jgi:hypothetical protein